MARFRHIHAASGTGRPTSRPQSLPNQAPASGWVWLAGVSLTVLAPTGALVADDAVETLPVPAAEVAAADEQAGTASAADARRVIEEALSRSAAQRQTPTPVEAQAAPAGQANLPRDLIVARLSAEVAARQLEARRAAQRSAAEALELLDTAAADVAAADIPTETRTQLTKRIDRARREIEEMTGKRASEIALDKKNAEIESKINRERAKKVEVDQRLAMIVDEYNTMIDERRYAEAEALAKKAAQLSPDNPVVRQLLSQSRMIRRLDTQKSISGDKEEGFIEAMVDVDRSSTPFVGPIEFPATKDWEDLTKNRNRLNGEGRGRASPAEAAIHKKLSAQVVAVHRGEPLAAVLDSLAKQAEVPIHLDMVGMESEGVRSDTPVTISLEQKITLKSALKLLLEPLHLDYCVKDEVLKVTSPRLMKGQVFGVSYQVADLVIPIPNFVSDDTGLEGAINGSYSRLSTLSNLSVQTGPAPGAVARAGTDTPLDGNNLAQIPGVGGNAPQVGSSGGVPLLGGPAVGGAQADFQSLIDLIQNTVAPQTWNTVGGQGAIQPFPTNLSIVVSQTQEVHDEIADLLQQLRRLQDLQVAIEVRFIRLNDTFFERIGVDFDFNIQSNVRDPLNMTAVPTAGGSSTSPFALGIPASPGGPTQTIGLDNVGNPGVARIGSVGQNQTLNGAPISNFYSIPFRQNSFGAGQVPSMPGLPDPTTSAATFGFAILSDIEAYFLIQAAQGNTRSNVMQAPKVTLFNGQNAFINDSVSRPFVTSVIPVVGDFAAAQQPVITVLNEGTSVNVQAVVSNDRRFVRLTLIPRFSQIGKVQEFQFEGSRSTSTKSADEKSGLDGGVGQQGQNPLGASLGLNAKTSNEQTVRSSGTTIQQPELIQTSITTTVSVPDGGTVLLGGIKRLREGRNEFGVPILSKIPYINRLFKNVGMGRTTDSLMLMVTPRIIIQEEEEDKLLGVNRP
jgi:general secretion pathway protein D